VNDRFDIVDAQVHLNLELDEHKLLVAMDTLGISGAVIDEFWYSSDRSQLMPCASLADGGFRPLSAYAQAAALRYPDRFCYLQRVEGSDPERAAVVRLLLDAPGCRALRMMFFTSEQRAALGAGIYDDVLGLAQVHVLPMCLLGVDAPTLQAVTARFPSLPIVLDHCGWVQTPGEWDAMLATAAIPTVFLKWSHAGRAFGQTDDPARSIQREFLRALEAFGAERILWASDFTQDESGASWAELLAFVSENPELSEVQKRWVLGGTARAVFGWGRSTPNP
jgi:L-fuconolactonase